MLEPKTRFGAPEDAVTIAALASHVFLNTYATEGIRRDLAEEVLAEYSVAAFDRRLTLPERRFILAEQASALVGFAEIQVSALSAPAGDVVGAELVRLYVQPGFQRQGIGQRLLHDAELLVTAAEHRTVWLTVWEGNHRARSFYAAQAYLDAGDTSYSFQNHTYVNRVLAKNLAHGAGSAPHTDQANG